MAYVTGSAASAADIVTAIRNACTANGWTLTNDILSKGTCFVRLWSPVAGWVSVVAGRGQTGGGGSTLTGQSNASIKGMGGTLRNVAFTFPMTYHIHVHSAPDEVYVFVNYNGTYYQRMMFGQSNVAGLVGTGNFYDASRLSQASAHTTANIDIRMSSGVGSTNFTPYPYANYPGFDGEGGIDHSLTANPQWANARITWFNYAVLANSPSAWNNEAILFPAQAFINVASSFFALVLEPAHMRFLTIDNLNPEVVLTLGPDKWKIYPAFVKGLKSDYNSSSCPSTSTYGIAVRYDGP